MTSTAPTAVPVPAAAIRIGTSDSLRFQGADHGSQVSFFLVDNGPGEGPGLHRHPYTETFSIIDGEATLTVGEHRVVAGPGTTVVVPADTWHGFTNTGPGRLKIIGIHASDVIVQEWRD